MIPGINDDRFFTLIDHLERRRAVNDQTMWLSPVLVITGQAFLLQVLSDDGLDGSARLFVLLAGLAAGIAALLALLRGRAREVEYSEAIAYYPAKRRFPEVRSPLPTKALPNPSQWQLSEQWLLKRILSPYVPPAIHVWGFTLLLFIAADVAVYCAA